MDEIELLNAAAYMNGDVSNISDEVLEILNNHFNNIKDSYDNSTDFRMACVDAFIYYKDKPALCILLIRKVTDANINITYAEVPEFKDVVTEFGSILRKIRTIF